MRGAYLVQRLLPPKPKTGHPLENAHRVFGGGMLGLSTEAWDVLDSFCTVDYMGAAEYEFGSLPRSLSELSKDHGRLVTFEVCVSAKDIKSGWWRERAERKIRASELKLAKSENRKPKRAKKVASNIPRGATIYVVCRSEHRDGAEATVRQLAAGSLHTKGGAHVAESLDPMPGDDLLRIPVGWYELNNGWFFFTSSDMHRAVCELFEVPGSSKLIAENKAAG